MTIQTINVGTNPNDGTGDSLRTSFTICNNNFSYLNSVFSGTGNISANSLTVSGNIILGEVLSFVPLGAALQYGGTANSYVQMVSQNKSSLPNASTDYVATADNGTDSSYFVDMGIASSTYQYAGYESILPNDSYLIANGGNLLLNAGSVGKSIKFVVGGSGTSNIVGQITNTVVTFNQTTTSTSTSSGALQIAGGAGIAGNLNIGGKLNAGGDTSVTGNASISQSLSVTGGSLFTGAYNSAYTDGVILDYVTGNGRISVGTNDGIVFYNNGQGANQLAALSNVGDLSLTGNITATGNLTSSSINLAANSVISSAGGFTLINVKSPQHAVYDGTSSNITAFTANFLPGQPGAGTFYTNANMTLSYSSTIVPGIERRYFFKNVNRTATANLILPNSNNNKAATVIPIASNVVAAITLIAFDTTAANVVAIITNN